MRLRRGGIEVCYAFIVRCLLIQSELPASSWVKMLCLRKTMLDGLPPYEIWVGEKSKLKYLREFGNNVFILDRKADNGKLEPRFKKGVLVAYSEQSKGYRIRLPRGKKNRDTP
ncbi:hypothetical protein Trydic_g935 [Trypoxylus dichotomus]